MTRSIRSATILRLFLACCVLSSCGEDQKGIADQKVRITRKSDNKLLFQSSPIKYAIVDDGGGLVIPLVESDRKVLEEVTSSPEVVGDTAQISVMGSKIGEIRIIAGFANPFLYLRGDYNEIIRNMKAGGIEIIRVEEVPLSAADVKAVLDRANNKNTTK